MRIPEDGPAAPQESRLVRKCHDGYVNLPSTGSKALYRAQLKREANLLGEREHFVLVLETLRFEVFLYKPLPEGEQRNLRASERVSG